jgi:sensor histidine kinase YesM
MLLNCEIDPSAMNCKIPLFTLQPIVENAIIHGLNHLEPSGIVGVQIRIIRDQLHIHIQDNGRGISQEIINQVMNGNQLTNSLALSNIHARLRSLTGHGLHIESEIGHGTKVSLSIPLKR